MTSIAVYHIKGGVGKTATAVNLAWLAADAGLRTLICDLDPQASATYYFRVKPKTKSGASGLVKGGRSVVRSIKGTDYERLDLLPADFSYRNLDLELDRASKSKSRLSSALGRVTDAYDVLVIDAPPNINIVAESVFRAADVLLVPVVPSSLSIRSFQELCSFLGQKKKTRARLLLPFFSMVEKRKRMHCLGMESFRGKYSAVLDTSIPYLATVENMGTHREPVPAFAPRSAAAGAYRELWREVADAVGLQR